MRGLPQVDLRALYVESGIVHRRGDIRVQHRRTVHRVERNAERGHLLHFVERHARHHVRVGARRRQVLHRAGDRDLRFRRAQPRVGKRDRGPSPA